MKGWDESAVNYAKQRKESNSEATKANRAAVANHLSKSKDGTVIGIDPGVKTGFAMYKGKELVAIETTDILSAIRRVIGVHGANAKVLVRIEDARMATFKRGGKENQAKLQGAGSVKRDCKIWEDEMKAQGIPYKMVRPNKRKNGYAATKNLQTWQKMHNWDGRTSEHARVAAMIAMP